MFNLFHHLPHIVQYFLIFTHTAILIKAKTIFAPCQM